MLLVWRGYLKLLTKVETWLTAEWIEMRKAYLAERKASKRRCDFEPSVHAKCQNCFKAKEKAPNYQAKIEVTSEEPDKLPASAQLSQTY